MVTSNAELSGRGTRASGTRGPLERRVRTGRPGKDYRQGTQQGKLLFVFQRLPPARGTGLYRSRFRTGRSPWASSLAPKHGRSHPDSATDVDAASLHGLSASPGQRTLNETNFSSRRHELNEAETTKPNKLCVLTFALTREQKAVRSAAFASRC